MKYIESSNDRVFTKLSFGVLIIGLVFLSFGCGKKSGGGSSRSTISGNYRAGQSGYGGIGVVARSGAAVDMSGRYHVILGVAVPTNSNLGYGPSPANVEGELQIYQPVPCPANPYLGLNAGRYKLIPIANQYGSLELDLLLNVTMQIQGTNSFVTIPRALFGHTNVCGYEGMVGGLNIETINNNYCGFSSTFNDYSASNMCR